MKALKITTGIALSLALGAIALTTPAKSAAADPEGDCQSCCELYLNDCNGGVVAYCAQPIINSCVAAGGDLSSCSYQAYVACSGQYQACHDQYASCSWGCRADVNYCSI
jgi:hypothetical protein